MSSNIENEDKNDSSIEEERAPLDNQESEPISNELFSSFDSAYELEPFFLSGELNSPDESNEETVEVDSGEFDREVLIEAKLREKLEGKVKDEGDQVDTIPPESAPNKQIENQIEMKKSGVYQIPNIQVATNDELEDKEPSIEQEIIDQFIHRKRSLIEQSSEDPHLGTVVGNRYKLESLIGKNYSSLTYKAKEVATGNLFAAKTHQLEAEEDEKIQFEQETEIASSLSHENIIKFIDTAKSPSGELFSITEMPKGISLKDVIFLNGPITSLNNLWVLLGPICDALAYAHRQSVIHGNLHSGNIVIAKESKTISLKVLDFGTNSNTKLALLKQSGEDSQDNTFLYFSPEQCGGKEQTSLSDIYNLGVLTYELITGKPPYFGKSAQDIVNGHLNESISPKNLSSDLTDIPLLEQLERLIFRALDSDPDMRISSALEFKLVLKDWFERASKIEA